MTTRPAFDDRFEPLAALAYRVAYRLLGDRGEAEEVAQETLARAFARWRSVAGHDEPWVARVATNLAIGRHRSRRRRPTVPLHDGHEHDGRYRPPAVDLSAAALERRRLVDSLRRLPRRQREVAVLRYLADLPESEVAAALRTTVGSVKQHAHRAVTRLRADLADPPDPTGTAGATPTRPAPEVDDVRAPR